MDHVEAGSGLQDIPLKELDNPLSTQMQTMNITDIGFCASHADNTTTPSSAVKRRHSAESKQSLGGMLRHAIVEHQLGITLNLLFLLGLTYAFFPSLRDRLTPFFQLQHAVRPGVYTQGPQDIWLVFGMIILFSGMRAGFMDYVLMPFTRACGVRKKKMQIRFAEQAYLLLYYSVFWTWGFVLFVSDTPSSDATTTLGWINDLLISLWRDFPRLALSASMKGYYLGQMAFWIQQIVVIHLEDRRKDHWQMLAHHFITVGLMTFSYGHRQMRAGNAILVLMDVVDLVFPLAKCLRYLGLQTACDVAFGVFVVTWFLARHVSYMAIFYSLFVHINVTGFFHGTYDTTTGAMLSTDGGTRVLENLLQPLLDPTAKTFRSNANTITLFKILLGSLQLITIAWGAMICKVVIRVLRGEGADDSRSDDEGEDEDEEEVKEAPVIQDIKLKPTEQKYIEITADADDLYYPSHRAVASSSSGRGTGVARKKSKGISSGLSLGDRKDILNRIGCLSEEQLARERERRQESTSPKPGIARRF